MPKPRKPLTREQKDRKNELRKEARRLAAKPWGGSRMKNPDDRPICCGLPMVSAGPRWRCKGECRKSRFKEVL